MDPNYCYECNRQNPLDRNAMFGKWICDDCKAGKSPHQVIAALRAEIEALRGKARELDARLADSRERQASLAAPYGLVRNWLRELGLVEARDGE